MKRNVCKTLGLASAAALAFTMPGALAAQDAGYDNEQITVMGSVPDDLSGLEAGPEFDGVIASREGAKINVATLEGRTPVLVSSATSIQGTGGFLGVNDQTLTADALLNGLPVKVRTVRWGNALVASRIKFSNDDYETAMMIRNGTAAQFAEQGARIDENAALAEALRGRVANIDQYNIKGTTNVYFDTGKWRLTPAAEAELCRAASEAGAMDNALLLVVGYTDSTGSQEINQELSEKRAGRVVNFLQQECDWQPWRMLSPTGMAEADPLADNMTEAGKAQNRRVAVNILVSKAVDGGV